MGRVTARNDGRLNALIAELEVLRPDDPAQLAGVLAKLRELWGVEALVCSSPVPTTSGWVIERFIADGLPNPTRFRSLSAALIAQNPEPYGFFDADAPESPQRNVLVDVRARVPAKQFESSRAYREVLAPLRLHEHHLYRAVLCEGRTVLAWLGLYHPTPLTDAQRKQVTVVLPALRKRLAHERQLAAGPLISAALEVVLDQIAAPAFVVGANGRLLEVNEAGRALLTTRRAELAKAITATLANEEAPIPIDLTPLDSRGAKNHWLAVLRTRTEDSRVADALARAATRLGLTRRQREVLEHVITGGSNATIADALRVSERAIEQHLTAIFDRAAVDSRAALVTYVLLG
jgi:DNA-binding CsgD family transcriptional regulator